MNEKIAEPQPHATVNVPKEHEGLALERTKLAEERTQLAYIRTGITLLLGGLAFVGYFRTDPFFSYVGYATIVVAVLFMGYGFRNHKKSKDFVIKVVDTVREEPEF